MSAAWSEDVILGNVKRLLLAKSGINGVRHAAHLFRKMDTNKDGSLSPAEFKAGLAAAGVPNMTDKDVKYLVLAFDKDRDGRVTVDEFLRVLIGSVNSRRRAVLKRTFAALTQRNNGAAMSSEWLVAQFDASMHPSVEQGRRTLAEVQAEFTGAFGVDQNDDGVVSQEEFTAFFTGLSATVPSDEVFEVILLECFHADDVHSPHLDSTKRVWGEDGDPLAHSEPQQHHSPLDGKTGKTYDGSHMGKAMYSYERLHSQRNPSMPKDHLTTMRRDFVSPSTPQLMASFGKATAPERVRSATGDPAVDSVRDLILKRVGPDGFVGLQRSFRTMDKNKDMNLSQEELDNGLKRIGAVLSPAELRAVYTYVDRNSGDNGVTVGEFCRSVRGEITSDARLDILRVAFDRLDSGKDGRVSIAEVAVKYDTSRHADVVSGKKSKTDVVAEFIADWDGNHDGVILFSEWVDYYTNISCTIDNDQYFELMIRNAWHISGGTGQAANTTCRRVLAKFADGHEEVLEVKDDIAVRKDDINAMKRNLAQQGYRNIVGIRLTA